VAAVLPVFHAKGEHAFVAICVAVIAVQVLAPSAVLGA
jgi:hypothetical protein